MNCTVYRERRLLKIIADELIQLKFSNDFFFQITFFAFENTNKFVRLELYRSEFFKH